MAVVDVHTPVQDFLLLEGTVVQVVTQDYHANNVPVPQGIGNKMLAADIVFAVRPDRGYTMIKDRRRRWDRNIVWDTRRTTLNGS